MGFIAGTSNRVKGWLTRDKTRMATSLAKGATSSGAITGSGRDMLQVFGHDAVSSYINVENDLMSRFSDYEEMDDMPEVSSGIDIYADDSTQRDSRMKRSVWVESPDKTIEQILDRDLFQRTLRIDEEIWEIARTLVKYGNDYEEVLVTNEGVVGVNFLPPATIRRLEGSRGELYGFVQDFRGRYGYTPGTFKELLAKRHSTIGKADPGIARGDWERPDRSRAVAFEDWEVVHFRLRGRVRRSIYGHSALEAGRWIWKRLQLLEDAALIYRLQRAPERFAFYIDVGDLPPAEAHAYVNRVKQAYKKKKFFDPSTGKLNLKWEPLSQDDDFFIPVRQDKQGARIEVLGAPAWQHMDDIEYFRDKLFAAMKIPKAYLGQEQGVARQILSQEDVRFARTILRVQNELRTGMSEICRIHLAALNINPYKTEYDVQMTVPSAIFELAQMEVRNARADLAERMKEFVSNHYVLSEIFDLSDEDIETITKQKESDVKIQSTWATDSQIDSQSRINKAFPETAQAPQAGQTEAMNTLVRQLAENGSSPALTRKKEALLRRKGFTGMSEEELFSGSKGSRSRANDKLETLLKNDHAMARSLKEVGGLLRQLAAAQRSNK